MRALLDAQAILWFVAADRRLGVAAKATIDDLRTDLWASAATLWEIAIKASIGKLPLHTDFVTFANRAIVALRLRLLPTTIDHIAGLAALPFHHRDPFDRMLIAQAIEEEMPVVSADSQFDAYPVTRIW